MGNGLWRGVIVNSLANALEALKLGEWLQTNAADDSSFVFIKVEPYKKDDANTSIHSVDSILEMLACVDPGPRFTLCLWVNLFY